MISIYSTANINLARKSSMFKKPETVSEYLIRGDRVFLKLPMCLVHFLK